MPKWRNFTKSGHTVDGKKQVSGVLVQGLGLLASQLRPSRPSESEVIRPLPRSVQRNRIALKSIPTSSLFR